VRAVEIMVRHHPKAMPTRVRGRTEHQSRTTRHRAIVIGLSRSPLSVSAFELFKGLSSDDSRSSVDSPHWLFRPLFRFQGAPGDLWSPGTRLRNFGRRWCPQTAPSIRSGTGPAFGAITHAKALRLIGQAPVGRATLPVPRG